MRINPMRKLPCPCQLERRHRCDHQRHEAFHQILPTRKVPFHDPLELNFPEKYPVSKASLDQENTGASAQEMSNTSQNELKTISLYLLPCMCPSIYLPIYVHLSTHMYPSIYLYPPTYQKQITQKRRI